MPLFRSMLYFPPEPGPPMLPIALVAGLAGAALAAARFTGHSDMPFYVFGLTLAGAVVAVLARQTSTFVRAIIGFLLVWHLAALALLIAGEAGLMDARLAPYLPTRASILLSVIFASISWKERSSALTRRPSFSANCCWRCTSVGKRTPRRV